MKKGWERNSPNFAPPLILEKIRRNFTTKLRLLVLCKLSWNVVFSHRRKLRIWIFRSAYALQYKYSRNVWLKERFEAVCAVSLFLKDSACPLKAVYRLQCIAIEGQKMLTSIFMAHLSDPLNQGEISRYIYILTILFLGSINIILGTISVLWRHTSSYSLDPLPMCKMTRENYHSNVDQSLFKR